MGQAQICGLKSKNLTRSRNSGEAKSVGHFPGQETEVQSKIKVNLLQFWE